MFYSTHAVTVSRQYVYLLFALFWLTGCGSRQEAAATATPAAEPTAAATATAIPVPTATATAIPPTRVEFAPDSVERSFSGELFNGEADFVFSGEAGHRFTVELGAADPELHLTVADANGVQLKPALAGANRWSTILPATQEYAVQLRSPQTASGYALTMMLVDPVAINRSAETVQVVLDAVTPDTVVEGVVEAGVANQYRFYAEAGQTLSVEAASPKNDLLLALEGVTDGQTYKSELDGSAAWTGLLPLSQEYLISVIPAGERAEYTLAILLDTAAVQSTSLPEAVNFEAGADTLRLRGVLDAGGGPRQYVLTLGAGQFLSIIVHSSGAPIQISADDQAGQRWVSESSAGLASELTLQIPRDGEYIVTLSAPLAAGETSYQASLIVR